MTLRPARIDGQQLHALPWSKLCLLARWLGARMPEDGVETPERRARAVAWCEGRVGALVGVDDAVPTATPETATPPKQMPRRR